MWEKGTNFLKTSSYRHTLLLHVLVSMYTHTHTEACNACMCTHTHICVHTHTPNKCEKCNYWTKLIILYFCKYVDRSIDVTLFDYIIKNPYKEPSKFEICFEFKACAKWSPNGSTFLIIPVMGPRSK